jgi:hypothetical protein
MTNLEFHLDRLAEERIGYSRRLQALLGSPDHRVEAEAYLRLIEMVNSSALRLAKDFSVLPMR